MNVLKPLLAATLEDPAHLVYPVAVSPKLDGIRALVYNGQVVSRNLKPIRNAYIQQMLKDLPEGLDGELIVGAENEGLVFNRTSSGVMSEAGEPEFLFHVFDSFKLEGPFFERYAKLQGLTHPFVKVVPHRAVTARPTFDSLEQAIVADGYEGIMIRGLQGRYKFGRATHNDRILWKFKRFRDGEAVVLSVEEGVVNNNPVMKNELGYSERSTHAANLAPSGKVGTIIGKDVKTNEVLNISPGRMDHADRVKYMAAPHLLVSKIVKYKTFDYGRVDASRFCTFQGIRDEADMAT